jgi:hypothetical protein
MRIPWTAISASATDPLRREIKGSESEHVVNRARRRAFLAALGALPAICGTRAWGQAEAPDPIESKERVQLMRRFAQATRLSEVEGGKPKRPSPPRLEPLVRYTDPPRGIQDATLWAWGERGRPFATLKVERWSNRRPANRWNFGIVSLATGRVEVEFSDGLVWQSRKPGWDPQPIMDAPPPAASAAGRLIQMKELARRFSVTIHSVHNPNPLQLRLMPTPIDRYGNATAEVVDGALFALSFGTNPTVLLALEGGAIAESKAFWRFGFARQGSGEMIARLDDKEVWTQPFALEPDASETYTSRTMPEAAEPR